MEEEENLPVFKSSFEKPVTKSSFDKLGKAYSNNLYYNTGFGKSSYDENFNFDSQFNELDPIGSINENRAQSQSNVAKIGAGIGRIGTKAISEIVKIPGVIGGIIAAPFAEEGKGWETAFDNQWIKSISQLNEDINSELLPVYVKKAVSEGNLWDNISSIDFWATEGADGIGFIASMLAPGAALKSLNLGQKILGTTAKGLSMINGEAKLAGAVRTLESLGINAKNIDLGAMTMANTLVESASESGSAMNSFQKDIDRKLASGEIDQYQYEQLQTQKAKLGRDIFVSNLAILLVPNAIQTKMIWGKGVGSQLVKDTPSLITKVANRSKNVLGALGSEGFLEEGLQSTVETMFSNKAKRGELTDSMSQDFNISELVSSYIDTLNTTEGQKAIFLGGVLGGGMSAYQGGKSDIATRKETQDVLTLAEEKVGIFNRINETDVYKRNENGDIVYNYNNKPQYDPVKVKDVAKALEYTEEQSQLFDQAIQEGNTQVIQTLKNDAINQLVTPFINRGELGIQALSQYLDVTLKTEEIAENEDAKSLKSKIIEQATYMQDQLNTYKDFSKSLINLNNPDATKQDIVDYYNRLGDVYINLKGSEYFQKGELKKLNIQKSKLLKDLGTTEISTELNPDYIEGKTEEIYKFNNKPVDARVKLLNDQIEKVNNNLFEIDKIINDEIWNNKKVNESFNKKVKENNELREKSSQEQIARNDEVITAVKNATTEEEVTEIEKTTPKEVITNPVIKKEIDTVKNALAEAKRRKDAEEIANATQEDNDFNDTTTYTDLNGTEGSPVTDELTPEDEDNSTAEEIEKVKNEEVLADKGAQVISSYLKDDERGKYKSGETIPFMFEQYGPYLKYEKTPINKIGKEVKFEINQLENDKLKDTFGTFNLITSEIESHIAPEFSGGFLVSTSLPNNNTTTGWLHSKALSGSFNTRQEAADFVNQIVLPKARTLVKNNKISENVKKALQMLKNKDFSNPEFLISYLPINAVFEEGIKAPMETRRANGKLDTKKDKNGKDQFYIDPASEMLRINIVNHLINGGSINDITTTVQDQYKGLLKVDDNKLANNNILELDGVTDLKYVRDNLYVVDSFGNLMNIQTGKTKTFSNGKLKPNAAGEIYLSIPQANGKPFPLKLNIKKINESEAVLLYEIYKEILTNEKSLNTTVSETNPELQEAILTGFAEELKIIGGNKNDIKLQEIVDLLIYQSDNVKSRMQIDKDANGNTVLLYSNGIDGKIATKETIEEDMVAIINYLENNKRHQIKINPKSATDNTRTNLKSNAANYIKYLIDNLILSTNAVVNEPTFQGYTNIYLNTGITVNNQQQHAKTEKVAEFPLQEGETLIDKVTDKKGNTHTTVSLTTEKEGLKKTKFLFNRSDKNVGQRNMTSISPEKLSSDFGFEIPKDNIPEGTEVTRVKEIRETDKSSAATVTLKDTESDESWDAEIVITKKQEQLKVSESGVQISADDMGLNDVFESEPKVENKIFKGKQSFAHAPYNNGFDVDSKTPEGERVFKITENENNPNEASYELLPGNLRLILNYPGRYIKPVADEMNAINQQANNVIFEPGLLIKNGNAWVISKKAKIYYGDKKETVVQQPKVGSDVLDKIKSFTENKNKKLIKLAIEINNQTLDDNNFAFNELTIDEKFFLIDELIKFNNPKILNIIKEAIYNTITGDNVFVGSEILQAGIFDFEATNFNDLMGTLVHSVQNSKMNYKKFIGQKSEYFKTEMFKKALKVLKFLKNHNSNIVDSNKNIIYYINAIGNTYDAELANLENKSENKSKVVSNIELENQKRDLEFNNKIEFLKNNDILLATHFLLSKKGIVENYGSATSVLTTILKIKYSEAEKLVNEHTNAGKTKDFKFGDEYNYAELDFKLKKLLENKSENTRNSQESFVSLSEIKGTVENTQLNETQAKVFRETKTPSELLKDAARMALIIKNYKESLKEGSQPLNARDQAKLNKWAEENPEAYRKIC